jgi:hypothetical protein
VQGCPPLGLTRRWFHGGLRLGDGGQDFGGGADVGEAGEDFLEGEGVELGGQTRTGVFDDHEAETEAGALSEGGFDTHVGSDAGQNDCLGVALLEELLEVCAGEGSPMAFGDLEVAGLHAGGICDLRGGVRDGLAGVGVGFVDRKAKHVGEVDVDVDHGHALGAEGVGELAGASDDVGGFVRVGVAGDDGVLEVDENEGCG